MKIFLFSTGFIVYMIELANSLSKLETTVLMLPENHMKKVHFDSISKDVIFEPFYMPRQRNPACILMMKKIVKTIKKHNPDVLHIQAHGHPWFFIGLPFLRKYPIVNTVHDPKPHLGEEEWRYRLMTKIGIKYSDLFLVHGKYLRKKMSDTYKIPLEKITAIPKGNYAHYKNSAKGQTAEEPHTILFFGRLVAYKGLEYLIRAEPLISKEIPDLKIIVAVHGDSFSKYERYVVNRDRFEVVERYIPDEEVATFFQRASVVVLPYIEASQTGIVCVAYPFKKPVVVTNVGGLPEIVINGKTGFIVPPKDEKSLAKAIVTLLKNDKLRKEMGENAYKYAFSQMSWEKIAEIMEKVYKKVLDEKCKSKL